MCKTSLLWSLSVLWLGLLASENGGAGRPADKEALGEGRNGVSADQVAPQQQRILVEYVKKHHQPAVEFVVDQFRNHDIVLLGETHGVAENCRFVASLLEPMYRAGVRTLATEFTRSSRNTKLNHLITAPNFDRDAAVNLFRSGPWATWGYRDYVNILEAAWRLNHQLKEDAPKFRVIGIESDWTQYDLWFAGWDRARRFQHGLDRERHLTKAVKEAGPAKNRKLLVHIGMAHTVTTQGVRLGKVLADEYGDRLKQVTLHHRWPSRNGAAPITGLLETLASEAGQGKAIGFDIIGTPLGELVDKSVVYWAAIPNARLGDFAQSYVVLKPLSDLHGMTWIRGFITQETFKQAHAIAVKMKYIKEDEATTPRELDALLEARFSGKKLN